MINDNNGINVIGYKKIGMVGNMKNKTETKTEINKMLMWDITATKNKKSEYDKHKITQLQKLVTEIKKQIDKIGFAKIETKQLWNFLGFELTTTNITYQFNMLFCDGVTKIMANTNDKYATIIFRTATVKRMETYANTRKTENKKSLVEYVESENATE